MKLTGIKNALAIVLFMSGYTLYAQQGMGLRAPMVETLAQLDNYQMTGDPDHDFTSMMLIHKRGSLEILDDALTNASDNELLARVKDLKQREDEEITELEKFYSEGNVHTPNTEFVMDMKTLLGKTKEEIKRHSFLTGDISQDFNNIMTANYVHGIEMLNLEMKYGKNAELKSLAKKMLESHEKELSELQKTGKSDGMGTKGISDSVRTTPK